MFLDGGSLKLLGLVSSAHNKDAVGFAHSMLGRPLKSVDGTWNGLEDAAYVGIEASDGLGTCVLSGFHFCSTFLSLVSLVRLMS